MKDKLRILVVPFALCLIILLAGYTSLHWLLLIRLKVFSLKQMVTDFWIPIVLTAAVVFLTLRPRLKILNLTTRRGSWRDFYCLIAIACFFLPLLKSQEYIRTATGKLTELASIKDIGNYPLTKYYSAERYFIDQQSYRTHPAFETRGKANEDLSMTIFVVMPMFEDAKDSLLPPAAWLGVRYYKTISNRLQPQQKEAAYQHFAEETEKKVKGTDLSRTIYFKRVDETVGDEDYLQAAKTYKLPGGSKLYWKA